MAMQIDYILATGLFIIILGLAITFTTNNLETNQLNVKTANLRSNAMTLIESGTRGITILNSLNLTSQSWKFWVLVNNTASNLKHGSLNNIQNEIVEINFTRNGINFEKNTNLFAVILENKSQINYEKISTDTIRFITNISANQEKWFLVYFNPEENKASQSIAVSGTDNTTEKIISPVRVPIISNSKMNSFNNSNYNTVKQELNNDNFRVIVEAENQTIMSFGDTLPKKGNIISLKKYLLTENSANNTVEGSVTIQVW